MTDEDNIKIEVDLTLLFPHTENGTEHAKKVLKLFHDTVFSMVPTIFVYGGITMTMPETVEDE